MENPYPYPLAQACPCCAGTGLRSIPPYVAGDQPTFTNSSCGPWKCQPCGGSGYLLIQAARTS